MQLPTRPVIGGFFPDPSVCVADGVYYLANSSFEYAPGVPIHRSTDLRTWQHIGNALDRPGQLQVRGAVASGGVFAPTLRFHDGRFWMITTNMTAGGGHLIVTAEDPAGPWSDPVFVPVGGIDPDLAWDDDGTCYLTWSGFGGGGPEGIAQAVIDPTTGKVLSDKRSLWQGTGGMFPEGPHLYRVDDFWYLLIAEGGTERGHASTIARSQSPSGPFEPSPVNPLVTARGSDSPVQNTGHADLVQRPDGSWAVVYLGVRPRGTSPKWHVLGRETFASDVRWQDGWPYLGAPIEPAAVETTETAEDLSLETLPMSWISPGRFPAEVMRTSPTGWRVATGEDGEPVFAGRRQTEPYCLVRAEIDASQGSGGLELRIDPRHAVRIELADDVIRATTQIGTVSATLGEIPADARATLEIRVEPSTGDEFSTEFGPDEIVLSVIGASGPIELGRLDGRYMSTETAGGMTGRVLGVVCSRGDLTIRSFTYIGTSTLA
jgi:xylan 1,4-beta-xylosidase